MDYRERLHRPKAYNTPGHAHELTFSCYQRYPFLSKDATCRWLAEAIHIARARLNYSLWAYVFMPNHVHLIVWPREPNYDDSEFLKAIKEPVSRKAIQHLKHHAPHWLSKICVRRGSRVEHHFWQPGRGHDRNVMQTCSLQSMIEYVHLNPVRAGLVKRARDWTWSSAGWFEARQPNNLEPDPIPYQWLEDAQSDS